MGYIFPKKQVNIISLPHSTQPRSTWQQWPCPQGPKPLLLPSWHPKWLSAWLRVELVDGLRGNEVQQMVGMHMESSNTQSLASRIAEVLQINMCIDEAEMFLYKDIYIYTQCLLLQYIGSVKHCGTCLCKPLPRFLEDA